MLAPASADAAAIAELTWVLIGVCGAVLGLVCALLIVGSLRRRDGQRVTRETPARMPSKTGERRTLRWVLAGGVALPLLTISGFFAYSLRTLATTQAATPDALTIDVVGHQFWWDVLYRDAAGDVVTRTANEIHVPVGRPVELRLRSADVIHSFWVPRLQGKLDLIPGRLNTLRLRARQAGVFRGQCAEYCGLQHTRMALLVIAQPDTAFERWLAWQRRPALEPAPGAATRGREVFLNTTCVACHAIRGVRAEAVLGPDLTHLASRRTLGAATVANTRGMLAGWISDPHGIKPGVRMPASLLAPEELGALLEYLMGLR